MEEPDLRIFCKKLLEDSNLFNHYNFLATYDIDTLLRRCQALATEVIDGGIGSTVPCDVEDAVRVTAYSTLIALRSCLLFIRTYQQGVVYDYLAAFE